MLLKDVQSNQMVTSDITPHTYRKAMLTITVNHTVWIIIISLMEIFCAEDFTMGKMRLTDKQGVICHLEVSINPATEFLLSTHVCRGTR
jgi:hypothetical protein